MEKQVGILLVNRKVPDFINNQKLVVVEMLQPCFQTILQLCFFQLLQKIAAFDEIGDVMVFCGSNPDGCCQMRLTNSARSEKDDILRLLHKSKGAEFLHLGFAHGRLEAEVKIRKCLYERKCRRMNRTLCCRLFLEVHFIIR